MFDISEKSRYVMVESTLNITNKTQLPLNTIAISLSCWSKRRGRPMVQRVDTVKICANQSNSGLFFSASEAWKDCCVKSNNDRIDR